jgi:phage repressor protein C with HTH and peptisase S24 domain
VNGAVIPWQRVEISGPSMVPTLRDGDHVVVRHNAQVREGDIVLARFRTLPDRLVVKRADRAVDDGWWLVSDNPFAGGDSATHGAADVLGRVVVKLRPGRPRVLRRSAS